MNDTFYQVTYELTGTVQGVGFRPAVYRLAKEAGLGGWIQNQSGKVLLTLEGLSEKIRLFIDLLPEGIPAHATLDSIVETERKIITSTSISDFTIRPSVENGDSHVVIPADLAVCSECSKEILDPHDRRYGYPFTTCTNCGPRYTVINGMPYDRKRTTLNTFKLCDSCLNEYNDPNDRRFHAESIACPVCGPHLTLFTPDREKVNTPDIFTRVKQELKNGKIIAIRSTGGFQLAVDPFHTEALKNLRSRKNRPHKPFALMGKNLKTLRKYCRIDSEAEQLLCSPRTPIVILDVNDSIEKILPTMQLINPETQTLGMMLPNTPLHQLLFEDSLTPEGIPLFELLIMTSGNYRGEPICIKNEEAFVRLGEIADFILCHDREINLRNDDSLCIIQHNHPQVWRRARGYAPETISLKSPIKKCVLAMGAEIKNTICLAYQNKAVMSPHIGDLETPEAVDGLKQVTDSLPEFLNKTPEVIAVDLHPDMHSTIMGKSLAENLQIPVTEVQHHHAHAVSCMIEHHLEDAFALIFDGTGLGLDGTIWGAELLYVNSQGYTRMATFKPVPLPGGDAAVNHPVRQVIARMVTAGIDIDTDILDMLNVSPSEYTIWKTQCINRINAPLTHAAGRLFDSFSAFLRIPPEVVTYEGQPAIRLESVACSEKYDDTPLRFNFHEIEKESLLMIDWAPLFNQVVDSQLRKQKSKSELAMAFHMTVSDAAIRMFEYGYSKQKTRNVVLSGGVFMNRILTEVVVRKLEELGQNVYTHCSVPPNDGGISLGQAVIANDFKLI